MAGEGGYKDLESLPANPYIQQRQTYAQKQAQQAKQQATNTATMGAGGGGNMDMGGTDTGWWAPTGNAAGSAKPKLSGRKWAEKMFSPQYMGAQDQIYESYKEAPKSLAEMYQGMMAGQPELEQIAQNKALGLVKGQAGVAQQMLMRGLPPGGMDSGAYLGGMGEINRNMQSGVANVGIEAYMKHLADQESRQRQMIEYTQGDINNRQGWQQGYGGFMQGQLPYEQFTIQEPARLAAQAQANALKKQMAIEQINAQRRAETMGYMQNYYGAGQQGVENQYQGQNAWQNYQGQQAGAWGNVYNPSWNPYQ